MTTISTATCIYTYIYMFLYMCMLVYKALGIIFLENVFFGTHVYTVHVLDIEGTCTVNVNSTVDVTNPQFACKWRWFVAIVAS